VAAWLAGRADGRLADVREEKRPKNNLAGDGDSLFHAVDDGGRIRHGQKSKHIEKAKPSPPFPGVALTPGVELDWAVMESQRLTRELSTLTK